jgi:predicted amidohydrolase
MSKLKLALCQISVGFDKEKNVQKAIKMIQTASKNGSKLVVLPVSFYF